MFTSSQQLHIANWHDSFVNCIGYLFGVEAGLTRSETTNAERDFAAGNVKKSTHDKKEKLNKDLADT